MEYLVSGVVIAALIGVFFVWAKKENELKEKMVAELTEEQREELKNNQVENFDDKKHTWEQKGLIGQVTDKGNSVALKVLWYNTVIQNATLNNFQYADIKMKKSEFEERKLDKNSIVTIFINPEKAEAKII